MVGLRWRMENGVVEEVVLVERVEVVELPQEQVVLE